MEVKKLKIEGLEAKELEIANLFNGLVDKYQELEGKTDKTVEFNEVKSQIATMQAELLEVKNAKPAVDVKPLSVAQAVETLFEEKSLKSLKDIKGVEGQEFELKADNPLIAANYPDAYHLTQVVAGLRFAPVRPYAFLYNGIKTGTVGSDKNELLWTVGSRTQNVAYIGELSDATSGVDGSTLTAVDKTRKLSKIVGRAVVSNESFEDLSQLAQRVQSNLIEGMELFLDQEIFDGEGNDSTKPNEIYGIIPNQSTAFNASLLPKVKMPNEADLASSAALQAALNYHKANTVWMSETLAFKLQRTKDSTGQYIINKLVDGTMMMGGLTVKTNEIFGGETEKMLVGDPAKIQYWVKRGLTAEFERVPKTDSYNLYVYGRQQVLVEDEDIKGLIYIDNVATALEAIALEQA